MFKAHFIKYYQRKIDKLTPKVNITLDKEIPLPSASQIAKYAKIVSQVNSLEEELRKKSDSFFSQKTQEFRELIYERTKNIQDEEEKYLVFQKTLEEILPLAFALVRESSLRTIGLRHFDVQILGGIVLNNCGIAEMATGEGKTLVATLPAYLNALLGKGVHIVTVNDYLAKRDREWMGPIYEFLGLSVGVIQQGMPQEERRLAYSCDITYGTNNEFGFDYLRDNMVLHLEDMAQRGHFYAIVDEVDSILIDEARTPLIISGPAEESTDKYYLAEKIASRLKGRRILEKDEIEAKYKGIDLGEGVDYLADERTQTVTLTEQGLRKCEEYLGLDNLFEDIFSEWPHHIRQALRAKEFFKRERDYIVKEGKVIIVDEFTGRLMPGRRWSDGLHQAIEAKEGLKIQEESQTLATITLQNYFKMYKKLAGMTGTAYTEAAEFKHIYNLDVVVIPTNKPLRRTTFPDKIYKTKEVKFKAVVSEIEEFYKIGRPILVGTTSIENSEYLSTLLKQKGIPHQVLNAKYHEREAYIVAQAGRLAQVTIATNMAGRGTDIILGGNPEYLVKSILKQKGLDPQDENYPEEFKKLLEKYKKEFDAEHQRVVELGGLHVIGTERHEARRIDNQLRGRAGRQGDPGSSRFYISLEDDLMRLFGSERIMYLMEKFGFPEDEPIEHPWVGRSIEVAQRRVEAHNFEIRKQLLEFDNVMNKQREVIYSKRREILEGKNLKEDILDMLRESLEERIEFLFSKEVDNFSAEEEKFINELKFRFAIDLDKAILKDKTPQELKEIIFDLVKKSYQEREAKLGDKLRYLERIVSLQVIDSRWKEHLLTLDNLKEGIHLRAYGQRNPIDEYQQEAFRAFLDMLSSVREGILDLIFRVEIKEPPRLRTALAGTPQSFQHEEYSPLRREESKRKPPPKQISKKKIGRNDPCPCGSGKKYKKCCGRNF
ncbi:MAG TPA: preprotein translocase subunit SecA [Candidatus Omnitrophica bacterium]|nr:MAG: preprotein translocase subunit SecA [Candidatus Omnitrophota bacterium]RKY44474.1 MAG: preprotein translocase subunit SecA [Candidatus Omnitrophota bacterium]HEC69902.1 preprotein translocase subunit SecA [Candidatus Omnitrophota bacterium]